MSHSGCFSLFASVFSDRSLVLQEPRISPGSPAPAPGFSDCYSPRAAELVREGDRAAAASLWEREKKEPLLPGELK